MKKLKALLFISGKINFLITLAITLIVLFIFLTITVEIFTHKVQSREISSKEYQIPHDLLIAIDELGAIE